MKQCGTCHTQCVVRLEISQCGATYTPLAAPQWSVLLIRVYSEYTVCDNITLIFVFTKQME